MHVIRKSIKVIKLITYSLNQLGIYIVCTRIYRQLQIEAFGKKEKKKKKLSKRLPGTIRYNVSIRSFNIHESD